MLNSRKEMTSIWTFNPSRKYYQWKAEMTSRMMTSPLLPVSLLHRGQGRKHQACRLTYHRYLNTKMRSKLIRNQNGINQSQQTDKPKCLQLKEIMCNLLTILKYDFGKDFVPLVESNPQLEQKFASVCIKFFISALKKP